ncbi:hypothetical protein JL101_034490 (plasmid) [Skermanella rosea]|uniref:hypothetical protein n=1 Tax=Skermanella rosea TaxID=1817965 RepID=UPI0019344FD0|nr:hypothetical protein [Skermanella rosea]UEM07966.1 hypothetical protein JL101_034490 [Skermanella rosea]
MNDDDSRDGERGDPSAIPFSLPSPAPSSVPSSAMTQALDILGQLRDFGVTLTEVEPTDAMVAAGMAVSGIDAERTRAIFRAMVAAGGAPAPRLQ